MYVNVIYDNHYINGEVKRTYIVEIFLHSTWSGKILMLSRLEKLSMYIVLPRAHLKMIQKDIVKNTIGASLVAQWLRVCLPMQGTWVRALVWEDPTCHGATAPVSHNYWACASGALAPPTREAAIVRGPRTTMKSGPRSPQLEKALTQKWRPNTAKNK